MKRARKCLRPRPMSTRSSAGDTPRAHSTPACVRAAERWLEPACFLEADARIRTADPFITSEVLYQLSYVGGARGFYRAGRARSIEGCRASAAHPNKQHALRHHIGSGCRLRRDLPLVSRDRL